MDQDDSADPWIEELRSNVDARPIVLVRLTQEEIGGLANSRHGMRQFTLMRPHGVLRGVAVPSLCLFFGSRIEAFGKQRQIDSLYLAILKRKSPASTLQSIVSIRRAVEITPNTKTGVARLFRGGRFEADIKKRLNDTDRIVPLGPKQSVELVDKLLKIESNRGPIRSVVGGLTKPKFGTNERTQLDAINMALRTFGLPVDAAAANLDLGRGARSALSRVNVLEDGVIEHDARSIDGYELVGSDVRGKASFRKGVQTLDVYTANRRKLEEAFGVDLIYMNHFHRNTVLVQYKMLEQSGGDTGRPDWVYYRDDHLTKQLKTMHVYDKRSSLHTDYRLNHEAFYFKFVRRRGVDATTNVLLPLEHFEAILQDEKFRSRSGGLRMSYEGLAGRYMRQAAFADLLQAGYIGTDTATTAQLRLFIERVLSGDNSLVLAVQRATTQTEQDSDRRRMLREMGADEDELLQ
jgi:hypothetical protein